MDGVVVTSDEEKRRLSALYGIAADAVIPSGIDLPQRGLRASGSGIVAWIGGHGYPPNRDGLVRFVEEAWEPLGQAGYRLLVAGSDPPPEIVGLAKANGIEILGFVEDLDLFLSQADVAVVPLWAGAGVKLKTVTFLGAGIPVVSTSIGIEGTGVKGRSACPCPGGGIGPRRGPADASHGFCVGRADRCGRTVLGGGKAHLVAFGRRFRAGG